MVPVESMFGTRELKSSALRDRSSTRFLVRCVITSTVVLLVLSSPSWPVSSASSASPPSPRVFDAPMGPVRAGAHILGDMSSVTALTVAPRATMAPSGWNWAGPGPYPETGSASNLGGPMMVFDAADNYTLLMESSVVSDTGGPYSPLPAYFAFNGTAWVPLRVTGGPSFCPQGSLAYDSSDGYVVYWGGDSCQSGGQTWTYRGGTWTNVSGPGAPSGRDQVALADDPAEHGVLMFGGYRAQLQTWTDSGYLNETWLFSGGSWTNLTLTAGTPPGARINAGMTYDPNSTGMILFGGDNLTAGTCPIGGDTWTFVAGIWTQLFIPGPPLDCSSQGAVDPLLYEPAGGFVLLVGAGWSTPSSNHSMWKFSAGRWVGFLPDNAPPTFLTPGLARSPSGSGIVLVGEVFRTTALPFSPQSTFETWINDSGAWVNVTDGPSPRYGAAITDDRADGVVLLFGGCGSVSGFARYPSAPGGPLGDTWTYSQGLWRPVLTSPSPPPRCEGQIAYDLSDGYPLLYGGFQFNQSSGLTTALNDTWEFVAGSWALVTTPLSPPASTNSSMVYDAADGYVLLATSILRAGTWVTETWSFHAGSWTNRTSLLSEEPPGPAANGLAYDSAGGYAVMYGTASSATTPNSLTWIYHEGAWLNETDNVTDAPPARTEATIVDAPISEGLLLFGGYGAASAATSYLNDTWLYSQGNWTQLHYSSSPPAREGMSGTFDYGADVAVFFGGLGDPALSPACLSRTCTDTWTWSNGSGAYPYVVSFSASPAVTDVGVLTNLTARVVGGTGPLTFTYTGLPAGCASVNASVLGCTPTGVGDFVVTLRAVDSAGNAIGSTTSLSVEPRPTFAAVQVSPPNPAVGERTVIRSVVDGGSEPLSYLYQGLPMGCATQSVPLLPCTPTSIGNFSLNVTARDSVGQATRVSTWLNVSPAGAVGAPQIDSYAITPSTIFLGNSTNISVEATFGTNYTTSLTYSYAGLPSGCASANQSDLVCSPSESGAFLISILVSAIFGGSGLTSQVQGNLTVLPVGGNGSALISAFEASPSRIILGESALIEVLASGGAFPLNFAYSGLPTGCSSLDSPVLTCIPSESGNYSLSVRVLDARGNATVATGLLVVLNANVSGTSPGVPSPSSGGLLSALSSGVYLLLDLVVATVVILVLIGARLRRLTLQRDGSAMIREMNGDPEGRIQPPQR
jgi:hypothetical protein